MLHFESTFIECAGLLAQLKELYAESLSLCVEAQLQRARSPWPHPLVPALSAHDAAPLPDQAAQDQTSRELAPRQADSIVTGAFTDAMQYQADRHAPSAQQIINLIGRVFDHLPLETQADIIAALCRRTRDAVTASMDSKFVCSA